MRQELRAVIDHSAFECGGREGSTGHPAWKLVVPHAIVSTKKLSIRLRQIQDHVSGSERERALSRLRRVLRYHRSVCFIIF